MSFKLAEDLLGFLKMNNSAATKLSVEKAAQTRNGILVVPDEEHLGKLADNTNGFLLNRCASHLKLDTPVIVTNEAIMLLLDELIKEHSKIASEHKSLGFKLEESEKKLTTAESARDSFRKELDELKDKVVIGTSVKEIAESVEADSYEEEELDPVALVTEAFDGKVEGVSDGDGSEVSDR